MIDKIIDLGISKVEALELCKVSKNIESDYKKLLEGIPIQYLIGYVNFYGYKIIVNKDVLIPRYETELLVFHVINYYKSIFDTKKVSILDLCCGSGNIAISLNKEIPSEVFAIDISKNSLKVAINNAKYNNANIKFIENDLINNYDNKFDIIVCNPPYISTDEDIMDIVKNNEPHEALYAKDNGLYYYKEIIKNVKKNLNKKYILAFEIGCNQKDELERYTKTYFNNHEKIIFKKDYNDKYRYLFIINE